MKKLTDGVVATSINWSTEKDRTRKSTADILSKLSHETGQAEAVTSTPELYSLQQSCDLLQSSYDDLYDDEDDETSSLNTGINTSPDDVLSNTSDSTLDHTFTSNSDSALNDIGRHDATLSANTVASRGHVLSKDLSDTLDSSSDHTFTPNSDTVLNDIDDRDAFSLASDSDGDEPSTSEDEADLYSPDAWNLYYSRLQEIGHTMRGREGWPNFDAVFMISAVDGDGVADIKVNEFCSFTNCRSKLSLGKILLILIQHLIHSLTVFSACMACIIFIRLFPGESELATGFTNLSVSIFIQGDHLPGKPRKIIEAEAKASLWHC